jgi:hypothetical protein
MPSTIATAINALRRNKIHKQQQRKQLIKDLGLTSGTQHSRLEGVEIFKLHQLDNPYPTPMRDIYETEEIAAIWRKHREETKHPDEHSETTGHWMELEKLDETKLQHVVGPNESAIFQDADTNKIVAVVIWQFCRNDEVLEWLC